MSTVKANTILPGETTHDITLGASGDTLSIAGNDLRVNTVKDKGGNTLWISDGSGNLSSVNAGLKGDYVLLTTNTASTSSSLSFTTGIDSTYFAYRWVISAIHPSSNGNKLTWQASVDGGDNYNVNQSCSFWKAYHGQDDGATGWAADSAEGNWEDTGYIKIMNSIGNDTDECGSGELWIFNPAYDTPNPVGGGRHKVWMSNCNQLHSSNYSQNIFTAGFLRTESAINALDFKMDTGTMDTGTIKMYGIR